MFKRLWLRWKFRNTAHYDLLADYETLIRLARRCAYDMSHMSDYVQKDSFFGNGRAEEIADHWVHLFAKGNPGKDYRHELQRIISERDSEIDELHRILKESGVLVKDNRIPF